jgi:hypothetical protein
VAKVCTVVTLDWSVTTEQVTYKIVISVDNFRIF